MEGEILNSHCFVDIDRSQLTRKLGPKKIRLRILQGFLATISGSARTSPPKTCWLPESGRVATFVCASPLRSARDLAPLQLAKFTFASVYLLHRVTP